MNILICGDVVGRTGREIILKKLPLIISEEKIDFVIVNGENVCRKNDDSIERAFPSFNNGEGVGSARYLCPKSATQLYSLPQPQYCLL